MPEQSERPVRRIQEITEAASVHTRLIEDACIDKDCIEELRVYLTAQSQNALNGAVSGRAVSCELLHVAATVKPISFHRGHFAIDLCFYYRIGGEVMSGQIRPGQIEGLSVFNKRVVLGGTVGAAKVFTSAQAQFDPALCLARTLPEAVVEAVDPIVLASEVAERVGEESDAAEVELPEGILAQFDSPLVLAGAKRQLYVTLGQFSTVRLERSAQLLVPVFDSYVPEKECADEQGEEEAPCEQFSRVEFPVEIFYPGATGTQAVL